MTNLSTTTAQPGSDVKFAKVQEEIPVLRVRNLHVKSKNSQILKDINLIVPKNKITVLLIPADVAKLLYLNA